MVDRTQLYNELLAHSTAESVKNESDYKATVAQIKHARSVMLEKNLAPPQKPLEFLAIGDSWFEYPLNGNSVSFPIPLQNTAIVAKQQLGSLGNPPPPPDT